MAAFELQDYSQNSGFTPANTHTDTIRSIFLRRSIATLCFRSMILLWLRMTLLRQGKRARLSASIPTAVSVSAFCDRFSVTALHSEGMSFGMTSSVNLLRINLIVRALQLYLNSSQTCSIALSPNSAPVRSIVSWVSETIPSSTFSYFSGTLMLFNFFFSAAGPMALSRRSVSILWQWLAYFALVFSNTSLVIAIFFLESSFGISTFSRLFSVCWFLLSREILLAESPIFYLSKGSSILCATSLNYRSRRLSSCSWLSSL